MKKTYIYSFYMYISDFISLHLLWKKIFIFQWICHNLLYIYFSSYQCTSLELVYDYSFNLDFTPCVNVCHIVLFLVLCMWHTMLKLHLTLPVSFVVSWVDVLLRVFSWWFNNQVHQSFQSLYLDFDPQLSDFLSEIATRGIVNMGVHRL